MRRRLSAVVRHGHDGEGQVGPVEAGGHPHRVAQAEARATMSFATCGVAVAVEATSARAPEIARGVGEAEVVGAEVVAPLRDAVGLVDDEQADPRVARCARRSPATRSARARRTAAAARPRPRARARRGWPPASCCALTSATRPGATAPQRLHLVLHQRDERRDDDGQVPAHQRRELVAERLARAGGHDDEHVAAGQRGRARLACPGRNSGKPKCSRSARSRSRSMRPP